MTLTLEQLDKLCEVFDNEADYDPDGGVNNLDKCLIAVLEEARDIILQDARDNREI